MNETMTRREFVRSSAAAGAALAALPLLPARAAETNRAVLALVGGAHSHTPGYVNLLKGRSDVTVKYVWDHQEARARQRAEDLQAPVTANLDTIWSDPEVVGVVICAETNRHAGLVTAAAKAKKHLFVEKPLGINGRESLAMARAVETAGLHFMTGYVMRTVPHYLFLKAQIEQGAFGRITRASAWTCHGGALGGWFDPKPNDPANSWRWMADPKVAGVGGFGDLGTHSLDILMWLLGDVVSVSADIRVITGRYGPACDEAGQGLLKFRNGVMGTLTAGWVDVANPVTLMLSGTEGHAVVVQDKLYFKNAKVKGADGKEPWPDLPKATPAPMHQFVDAILGQPLRPLVTPSDAAARVVVMDALYASNRRNRWVPVA